jgi:hypothetical protein
MADLQVSCQVECRVLWYIFTGDFGLLSLICDISGSEGGEYEDDRFLEYIPE